jgi:CheY-like chemotaxis protein
VLLVEDEASIADLVRLYLERDGFRVVWRTDGPSGLAAVDAERPRLVLLDLMLPGMDGFEVTRALRQRGGRVPIIVVTAREEEADRVLGLELGADDYVTKPFSPRELVARVKAVLRRAEPEPPAGPEAPLHLGSLTVDPARHEVVFEGRPVQLTAREFELLSAPSWNYMGVSFGLIGSGWEVAQQLAGAPGSGGHGSARAERALPVRQRPQGEALLWGAARAVRSRARQGVAVSAGPLGRAGAGWTVRRRDGRAAGCGDQAAHPGRVDAAPTAPAAQPGAGAAARRLAEDDSDEVAAVLPAVLAEVDTPLVRAGLVRAVLRLRDAGRVSDEVAAAVAVEQASGSTPLLRASLLEAVAVGVGAATTPAGLLVVSHS